MTIRPILHLKMAGDAKDSSGNGNDGVVTGTTLTEDRFGRPNEAYGFDGTEDFINCGNDSSLDINEITLSVWVKIDALDGIFRTIIEKGGSFPAPYTVKLTDDNKIRVTVANADAVADHHNDVFFNAPSVGTWFNIIGTYDGTILSLYVDGILVDTDGTYPGDIYVDNSVLYIGAFEGSSQIFKGKLDDIRIYNQALTPTQVKYIFDSTKRKYGRY